MTKVILVSRDGVRYEVDAEMVRLSNVLKEFLNDSLSIQCESQEIPIRSVSGDTLGLVVEFCGGIVACQNEKDVERHNGEFVEGLTNERMLSLLVASNYLDIPRLTDLLCNRCADLIKDMTPSEVRGFFGDKTEFTPEEEEEIRRDHAWAFV